MTDNAPTAADQSSAETRTGPEVACLIGVGDEVTGRDNHTWRAVVKRLYTGGIPVCVIETSTGKRCLAHPWALVPHPRPFQEWLDRMLAYQQAERDRALARLRRVEAEIVEQAETLAHELSAIADTLRAGRFHDPEHHDRLETEANSIDHGLAYLAEIRQDLTNSGLVTFTELTQTSRPTEPTTPAQTMT